LKEESPFWKKKESLNRLLKILGKEDDLGSSYQGEENRRREGRKGKKKGYISTVKRIGDLEKKEYHFKGGKEAEKKRV